MKSSSLLVEKFVGHGCKLLSCSLLRLVSELTTNFDGQPLQDLLLDEVVDRDVADFIHDVSEV